MPVNNLHVRSEMRRGKNPVTRLLVLAIVSGFCAPSWAQSAFTTWSRYDAAHRVIGTIEADPDGSGPLHYAAIRNTYDARGVLTRVEQGELATWQSETVAPASWTGFTVFRQIDNTYDSFGRTLSQKTSSGGVASKLTQFSYDLAGRSECTAVRMNTAAFAADLGLSACQLGAEGTLGPDRIERTTRDSSDRPLTVTKGYGTELQQTTVTYTYTNAHRASATDANGNKSTFNIDGLGRLEYWYFPSKTPPAGQSSTTDYEQYAYDENDNRTLLRKRDTSQIIFGYDALNRMTSKDLPGTASDVSFGYDLRGLQLYSRFSASSLGITNVYDGFGNLSSSSTNVGGNTRVLSYGYDANGNRSSITFPDNAFFQYAYDGKDRLWRICENDANCDTSVSPVISVLYNAQGRRSTLTRGASVSSTAYGYDDIVRLTSIAQDLDGAGTGSDVTQSFILNPASQVVSRTMSNTAYASTPAVSNRTYSVNGLNQYTQIASPTAVALTYDANGNLTSDGSSTYGYDVENRLTSASGTFNASLAYDPNGRLYQSSGASTTQYLYDGNHIVAEYGGGGALLRRYVQASMFGDEPLLWYEGSAVGSANRRYFHANHAGSVIAVANNAGSTIEKDTYDPYGVPGSLNTSRFQFTGQAYMPELGLYFYKARFYNPSLGRFMQTDPVGFEDGMNIYAYGHNDPMNSSDPSGTFCLFGIEIFGDFWGGCDHKEPAKPDPAPEPKTEEEKPVEDEVRDKVIEEAVKKTADHVIEETLGKKVAVPVQLGTAALDAAAASGSFLNSQLLHDYTTWKATGTHTDKKLSDEDYEWRGDTFEEALHNFYVDKGLTKGP